MRVYIHFQSESVDTYNRECTAKCPGIIGSAKSGSYLILNKTSKMNVPYYI